MQPRGVGAEPTGGELASAELVLHDVVHVLDRARLLPVPAQQCGGVDVATVAHDSQVLCGDLAIELELLGDELHGNVAQRLRVLGPVARGKLHVDGEHCLVGALLHRDPLLVGHRDADLAQLAAGARGSRLRVRLGPGAWGHKL